MVGSTNCEVTIQIVETEYWQNSIITSRTVQVCLDKSNPDKDRIHNESDVFAGTDIFLMCAKPPKIYLFLQIHLTHQLGSVFRWVGHLLLGIRVNAYTLKMPVHMTEHILGHFKAGYSHLRLLQRNLDPDEYRIPIQHPSGHGLRCFDVHKYVGWGWAEPGSPCW